MYHLVTNVSPAEAVKRAIDVWDGKLDPLENPAKLNPEISKEFSDFLLKSMEIRRENRFNSASEMKDALQQVIEESANPTLKQTLVMNTDEFQSQKTQSAFDTPSTSEETVILPGVNSQKTEVFNDAVSQETEAFNNAASQETAMFSGANSQEDVPPKTDTGNSGFIPQVTNELPQTNTAFNKSFDTHERNFVTSPQPVEKKSKMIWLVPVAALLLLMLGGGAFGVWYMMNRTDQGTDNLNNSNNSNTVESVNINSNTNTQKTVETTGQQGVGVPANTEEDNSKTETTNTPVKTVSTPKSRQLQDRPKLPNRTLQNHLRPKNQLQNRRIWTAFLLMIANKSSVKFKFQISLEI